MRGQGHGKGGSPELHEFSTSAPGTEAFKQDFARWDALRKDVALALEEFEVSVSGRLSEAEMRNRLNAGGDIQTPDAYREAIARYYQMLARRKPG